MAAVPGVHTLAFAESTDLLVPSPLVVEKIVVATSLGGHVDIEDVAEKLAHLNPTLNKPAQNVVFHTEHPSDTINDGDAPSGADTYRTTFMIWSNGRAILHHMHSATHALQLFENYVKDLHGIGYTALRLDHSAIHVRNVIMSATLGIAIDLPRLADRMAPHATYDPKDFQGAIIKNHPQCGSATLLAYKSGCVTVTGVRSKTIGDEIFARMTPLLRTFEDGLPGDCPVGHAVYTASSSAAVQ